jgi:hypothetical protein
MTTLLELYNQGVRKVLAAGLVFHPTKSLVLLQRGIWPPWEPGRYGDGDSTTIYNPLYGDLPIPAGKAPASVMSRICEDITGLSIPAAEWTHVLDQELPYNPHDPRDRTRMVCVFGAVHPEVETVCSRVGDIVGPYDVNRITLLNDQCFLIYVPGWITRAYAVIRSRS